MKSGGCYKCGGKVKMYNNGGDVTDDLSFYLYNPMAFMADGGNPPKKKKVTADMLMRKYSQMEWPEESPMWKAMADWEDKVNTLGGVNAANKFYQSYIDQGGEDYFRTKILSDANPGFTKDRFKEFFYPLMNPSILFEEGGMTPSEETAMLEQQMAQQEMSAQQDQGGDAAMQEQLIMAVAQILVEEGEQAAVEFLKQQGFPQQQMMQVLEIASQVAQEMSQQGGNQQGAASQEEQMMMEQMAAQQGMRYGGLAKFVRGGVQDCPEGKIYDPTTGQCVDSGIPYAGSQPSYYDFGQGTGSGQNLGAQSFPASFEEYANRRIEQDQNQIADKDVAAATRQNQEQFRDRYSRFFTSAEDAEAKVQKEVSEKGVNANQQQQQQQTAPDGYTLTHYRRLDKLKDPTKLDKTMAALSGLASPSNVSTQMLRHLPGGKGLAALIGLASIPGSLYMAGRKFTMKPVTESYDAEGNLITNQMGGEMDMYMMGGINDMYSDVMANGGTWDMFHNNRPKFNIGMPVYAPGGPVGSETSPLPFADWAQAVGYDTDDIKVPEIQQEYQDYVTNFSGGSGIDANTPNTSSQNNRNQRNSSSANRMSGDKRVIQRGDAAGTLLGINMLNAGYMMQDWAQERDLKRTMNQARQMKRNLGNTMNLETVNPVNPFGSMYTLNPGLLTQSVATAGYTQDLGTEYATAKFGGATKYKKGGTYVLSEEEIERIIQMGGEVEYLD